MKIVVNGKERIVIDLRIVYDNLTYLKDYFYFIEVKSYGAKWITIDIFRNAEDAIQRYEYLRGNINSDLVIVR